MRLSLELGAASFCLQSRVLVRLSCELGGCRISDREQQLARPSYSLAAAGSSTSILRSRSTVRLFVRLGEGRFW